MRQKRWTTITILCLSALPVTAWFIINRLTVTFPVPKPVNNLRTIDNLQMLFQSANTITNWDLEKWNFLIKDPDIAGITGIILWCAITVIAAVLWYLFGKGWYILRQNRRWEADLLGINTLFVPLFICIAACCHVVGYTQQRYAIPLSLPFLILVFQSLAVTSRRQLAICLIAPALAVSLIFPFYPPLWNQNWQTTLDYIESIKRPHDIVAINADSLAAYAFALAYDPENITFEFNEAFLAKMNQRPTPGKLPYVLLSNSMLDPELLRDLEGYRIILVMAQMSNENRALIDWFDRYYTLEDTFFQDSMREWAKVHVFVLRRKK